MLWKNGIKNYEDRDTRGYQALHVAVQNGHYALVHYLCLRGVDVDVKDKENVTPMHWAAIKGHLEIARYLYARGADPANQDVRGYNALHWAVTTANYTTASWLANEPRLFHLHRAKDAKGNPPRALAPKDKRIFSFMLQRAEQPKRLGDKQMRALWLLYPPCVVALLGLLSAYQFSILAVIIIMVAVGALSFYVIRPMFRPSARNDTLMIGIFYAHSLATFFFWLFNCFDHAMAKYGSLYTYTFITFGLSMIALHCYLVHSNPGTLRVNVKTDEQDFIDEVERDIEPASVCSSCLVRKPVRCKHDAVTDRCYIRFDHYCIWIFNVVGNDNHFRFMVMLLMCIAAHLWAFIGFAELFASKLPEAWTWMQFWTSLGDDLFLTYMLIFQVVNGIWESMLWYQQFQMIVSNVTMNEVINWHHYSHFWKDGSSNEFENPFDRGFRANLRAFFNQARVRDLYHLYHLYPSTAYNKV